MLEWTIIMTPGPCVWGSMVFGKFKKWMTISGAVLIPQSVHHKLFQDKTIAQGVCAGILGASMTPCAVALYQQDDYFTVSELIFLGNLFRTLNNTLRILVYSTHNPLMKMYRLSNSIFLELKYIFISNIFTWLHRFTRCNRLGHAQVARHN